MDSNEVDKYNLPSFPNPLIFCTELISLQAEIISKCIVTLASPFFSVISLLSLFFRPTQDDDPREEVFQPAARGGSFLLGRIAMGLLAAAYVCMVLIIVMVAATVLGVGLVRMWVEEPIYATESLQFDYADARPTAVFSNFGSKAGFPVPVGQTLYVSLVLLMPESDYNRDVGIFQLTAELVSVGGELVASSSRPCMLQFRSWPIRLVRTFLVAVPLLLGITDETQRLTFPILKHKEVSYPRTRLLRLTLIPRAGTLALPQFYDAQVLVKSQLPWAKELVYRWKWTFYVWTTLYIFIMLIMVVVFFLKPLIFPVMETPFAKFERDLAVELGSEEPVTRRIPEREVSGSLRRWQQSKRKAALLHGVIPESSVKIKRKAALPESSVGSSASSIAVAGPPPESGVTFGEGSGDSEFVSFGVHM